MLPAVAGVNINTQNKDDITSLMTAAAKGHLECLKELKAAGVEVNKRDVNGFIPLLKFGTFNSV